mmetsp:Transcript_11762/g.26402  ORF Transcript_11762/g.26402 Transcript_11762/m.26402 type:complete len:89 (-) Transcript_11762:416-682(-)
MLQPAPSTWQCQDVNVTLLVLHACTTTRRRTQETEGGGRRHHRMPTTAQKEESAHDDNNDHLVAPDGNSYDQRTDRHATCKVGVFAET